MAGLIDGEGCIYIAKDKRRHWFYPRVDVGMTERAKPMLEMLSARYGGAVRLARKATAKWEAAWSWAIIGRVAAHFLTHVQPHLVLKAEQARLALRLHEITEALPRHRNGRAAWTDEARARAARLQVRIHELNRKGPLVDLPEGAFARLVAGEWVTNQRDLLSDLGWEKFSETWPSSGLMRNGACWTHSSSEFPSAAAGSSLSQILEPVVPARFCLSPRAAAGILRRAQKRGRELPPLLRVALTTLASRAGTTT